MQDSQAHTDHDCCNLASLDNQVDMMNRRLLVWYSTEYLTQLGLTNHALNFADNTLGYKLRYLSCMAERRPMLE